MIRVAVISSLVFLDREAGIAICVEVGSLPSVFNPEISANALKISDLNTHGNLVNVMQCVGHANAKESLKGNPYVGNGTPLR